MAPNPQRILSLLERSLTAPEPTDALSALTALRGELDTLERHQVARALQQGQTFTAIARPLGISRQAAHRRYRSLAGRAPAPRKTPVLSVEARAALLRAREEAARHGSRSIDSEHLLLAIARTAPRKLLGLDVEAARRTFGPPVGSGPRCTRCCRRIPARCGSTTCCARRSPTRRAGPSGCCAGWASSRSR
jgi:transposase-like protein